MYLLSVTNPLYDKVESSPSETLVAWTDPAFPAFVEVSLSSHMSKSDFHDSSKLGLQDSEITLCKSYTWFKDQVWSFNIKTDPEI